MRFCTLLIMAATLVTLKPANPLPQPEATTGTSVAAEQRFRRMHLMRPDLLGYPSAKIGRAC